MSRRTILFINILLIIVLLATTVAAILTPSREQHLQSTFVALLDDGAPIGKFESLLNKGLGPQATFTLDGFSTNPLHEAIAASRTDVVQLLLDHGADPNSYLGNYTPLMTAIDVQSIDCIDILLNNGAEVDLPTKQVGQRPLLYTFIWVDQRPARRKICGLLLNAGANPNHLWKDCSPLGWAVLTFDQELVQMMVAHGADLDKDCWKSTPGHFSGNWFTARELVHSQNWAAWSKDAVDEGKVTQHEIKSLKEYITNTSN